MQPHTSALPSDTHFLQAGTHNTGNTWLSGQRVWGGARWWTHAFPVSEGPQRCLLLHYTSASPSKGMFPSSECCSIPQETVGLEERKLEWHFSCHDAQCSFSCIFLYDFLVHMLREVFDLVSCPLLVEEICFLMPMLVFVLAVKQVVWLRLINMKCRGQCAFINILKSLFVCKKQCF